MPIEVRAFLLVMAVSPDSAVQGFWLPVGPAVAGPDQVIMHRPDSAYATVTRNGQARHKTLVHRLDALQEARNPADEAIGVVLSEIARPQ